MKRIIGIFLICLCLIGCHNNKVYVQCSIDPLYEYNIDSIFINEIKLIETKRIFEGIFIGNKDYDILIYFWHFKERKLNSKNFTFTPTNELRQHLKIYLKD